MVHKAGFVNIIGNPNVGKSTLMNALVGEKLSIITSKAQTTRHRISGIVNGEDFQIVYSDTPGALTPNYKLQEHMMNFVHVALEDADILLFVTDITDKTQIPDDTLARIKKSELPLILLINKIDLSDEKTLAEKTDFWLNEIPRAKILAISAIKNFNIDVLFNLIVEHLPVSPPYYDKDQLTDKPEKFFISEIIREKILKYYQKEIPYAVEVVVTDFKDEPTIVKIRAEIMVERDSQKGIIIGHAGAALKKTGTEARKSMEEFLEKKVFLELYVKVNKNWRNSKLQLKRFGYDL